VILLEPPAREGAEFRAQKGIARAPPKSVPHEGTRGTWLHKSLTCPKVEERSECAFQSSQTNCDYITLVKETVTLGGGCFWCLEAVYDDLIGVTNVVSGYSGGHKPNPTYREVCSETTGHAEVIQVEFDPSVTSFKEILEVFFTIHDPTTLNRQGNDVGESYRSAVFYHSESQRQTTLEVINNLENLGVWDSKIVTQVEAFKEFFAAEDYHQDYFARNPNQGYCQVVVAPKVTKFRKKFTNKLKSLATA
jgi:peptide-methionine (S)-S-oxide reductase